MILLVNLKSFGRLKGLPSKTVCGTTALKIKNTTNFETKSTDVFKNYYSTLADNLLKKLPTLPTDILLTL